MALRNVAGAVIVCCGFQLWWFSRTCLNEIDFDGIGYVGIARHIHEGQLHAAMNAFRSPLLSWLIAALRFVVGDYVRSGKLANMASFVAAFALTYVLAARLWRSRLAASVAALLFVLARGFAAAAVEIVTPDFLLAALVLVYFCLLLPAIGRDRSTDWLLVGAVHGIAFLAKAFALPWLAVCTTAALVLSGKPWRTIVTRLAAAALLPSLIAAGWAAALHSKYGVFTAGSQLKVNLLQWTLHAYRDHHDPTYALLTNTAPGFDEYGAMDPMPPGSWGWTYRVELRQALPLIGRAEAHNVPKVLKEIVLLATPGGLLAYLLALVMVVRRKGKYAVEWRFVIVTAIAAVTLIVAYSMLVFDSRYLFPLVPVMLAVAAGFLTGTGESPRWVLVCRALVVAGVIFSLTYRASPFRTLTRDFETSCYNAGNVLKARGAVTVVSLGSGPFPEHGIGWEAGYKAAYFAGARLVATMGMLPTAGDVPLLAADVEKAAPDAILVWGRPDAPGAGICWRATSWRGGARRSRRIRSSKLLIPFWGTWGQ